MNALNETGEVHDDGLTYSELVRINERQSRELNSYRLKVHDLELELAGKLENEPLSKEVRDVLEHCKKVLDLRIKVVAGSEAWKKVKSRLRHFDVVELKAVPDGVKKSSWHMQARHRQQPQFLYRSVESVQELAELGLGIEQRQLRNGLVLSKRLEDKLASVKPIHLFALDECDCGHLKLEHGYSAPPHGFQKCLHGGCDCFDFDDFHRVADRWLAEQRRQRAAA